jgi:hypothetical protein
MKTTKLQKLARFAYQLETLNKLARAVRRINTNACNFGISKASETRRNNLESKAAEIAKEFGLQIHCQRDPRGAALYLVDSSCFTSYKTTSGATVRDCNSYTNGIALG